MRLMAAVILAGVSACGDEESCSPEDRDGLYLFEYTVGSGNCGPLTSDLVTLTNGSWQISTDCTETASSLSDDGCSMSRQYTCVDNAEGISANFHYAIRQDGADADRLEGTLELAVYQTINLACRGTYSLVITRQ